jgi:adenosyl cobinamide kinase/adenosyl cobinamide phosphate guanylyltransferase
MRRLFGCDDRTIRRGQQELGASISGEVQRIRKIGGGRKSLLATTQGLDDAFLEVIKNHTAGSPMDETIKWTNLSRPAIAEKLKEHNFPVSVTVVDQLLEKHHFHSRQAFKSEAGKKNIPQRDEQFKNIQRLNQKYHEEGHPVLSMDVKKKN